ncbi:hypothetical protein [Streptomyces sp. NPDC056682]|uniref:hypothetical protein n=1 Tax=Streptomyces sp. NPDC056682 TaxID=3345909 RepID=UPI0036AC1FF9
MANDRASRAKIRLIASDDTDPQLPVVSGHQYEVVTTTIVDSQLSDIAEETSGETARRPPRLCGSRSTCVAIVETE